MKLLLDLKGRCGTVSFSLDSGEKDFVPEEIGHMFKFAHSVVEGTFYSVPKEHCVRFNIKDFMNKISIIKVVRSVTFCGLKDAKDIVEGTAIMPWLSDDQLRQMRTELIQIGVTPEQWSVISRVKE